MRIVHHLYVRAFKNVLAISALLTLACTGGEVDREPPEAVTQPNILFISVDDLNDWIEPLGGHPQARTPNLNRLAEQAVTFTNAYTASPACNPSRTAMLTGMHTYRTGMYSNYQYWREVLPSFIVRRMVF